jgi:hypothetical protein
MLQRFPLIPKKPDLCSDGGFIHRFRVSIWVVREIPSISPPHPHKRPGDHPMNPIKHIVNGCCVVMLVSGFAGCSSSYHGSMTPASQSVALCEMGPETSREPGVFALGAGDALGQAIFTNYVTIVQAQQRANQAVVSGEGQ